MPTPLEPPRTNNTEAPSASSTITVTSSETQSSSSYPIQIPPSGTLRLRADAGSSRQHTPEPERRVQWAEDVVNNEGMGKKSSKVCCIYHKPRPVGESSDEDSSSDSSSDEESDNDDGSARPTNRGQKNENAHNHKHGDHCEGRRGTKGNADPKSKKRTPNAYERMPKNP